MYHFVPLRATHLELVTPSSTSIFRVPTRSHCCEALHGLMVIARVFAEHAARFWRSRCFLERLPDGESIALFCCVGVHQKENDDDANRNPALPLSSERRDRHYLVVIREGKTLKGRVLGFVVRTLGWGVWEGFFVTPSKRSKATRAR